MTTPAPERDAERDAAPVTVRRAEQADLLAVFRIEKRSFSQPWPFAAFDRLVGESSFLVATKPGDVETAGSDAKGGVDTPDTVVGFVVGDVVPNHGRDIGHVKDIAVDAAHRGDGLGRRLLTESLTTLAMRGASVAKLEVREGNEPALGLYREFGFEPVHRIPRYYGDGEAALVMVLDVGAWSRSAVEGDRDGTPE